MELMIPSGFATALEKVRARLEQLPPEVRARLEEKLELTPTEAWAWQDLQAQAHAAGLLSLEEASFLHRAIGTSGRWPPGVDLPTKVVVTQAIHELVRWSSIERR